MNPTPVRAIPRLALAIFILAWPAASAPAQTNRTVLAVRGAVEQPLALTLADLQSLPRVKCTFREKDGGEATFEGVPLFEVVSRARPRLTDKCCSNTVNTVVIIQAADHYQAVFSLPELDPKFSANQILLADRRAGGPLDAAHGPLQIIVPGDQAHARWVRQVKLIEVWPVGDLAANHSPPP